MYTDDAEHGKFLNYLVSTCHCGCAFQPRMHTNMEVNILWKVGKTNSKRDIWVVASMPRGHHSSIGARSGY